jgi:hypothetical protein
VRWFSAERTWGALKAGFRGTYTYYQHCTSFQTQEEVDVTSIAPNLNNAYVVYLAQLASLPLVQNLLISYRSKLDIIPQ